MKRLLVLMVLAAIVGGVWAQDGSPRSESPDGTIPSIGVIDVLSDSFDESQVRLFSDILRTEVFKLNRFQIVERGVIQRIVQEQDIALGGSVDDAELLKVGQLLETDKLLVCRIERFSNTIALNIRVIDVQSTVLDFTENVFISDENQIFEAIRNLVLNIDMRYLTQDDTGDPVAQREAARQRWTRLGANAREARDLISRGATVDEFLSIRQYDVTFTPEDYLQLLEAGWQPLTVIEFFKEGVPFDQVEEALEYGIADLEYYRTAFKPAGFTFKEYLDAYTNHIVTPEAYAEYQQGYARVRYQLGLGGVANSLPIANADFRFFLMSVGWEYFVTEYQRSQFKSSTEAGFFLMNGVLPSPYVEINAYVGGAPFYFNLAVGGVAEVFVGGHFGFYVRSGIEINEAIEFSMFATFFGTQPEVSYTDLSSKRGEPGYAEIIFPYVGAMFILKPSQFGPIRF